jgi:hypothetical protein
VVKLINCNENRARSARFANNCGLFAPFVKLSWKPPDCAKIGFCVYISMFHAYLKVFVDIKQDAVHKQQLFITKVTGFGWTLAIIRSSYDTFKLLHEFCFNLDIWQCQLTL